MSKGEARVVLQSAYNPLHPLGGAVSSDHVRDHLHQPLVFLPQPLVVVSQLVESLVCEDLEVVQLVLEPDDPHSRPVLNLTAGVVVLDGLDGFLPTVLLGDGEPKHSLVPGDH